MGETYEVDPLDVDWCDTAKALQAEVDRLRAENDRLRSAIKTHRHEFYGNVNYDDAPTRGDEALWATITIGGDS